MARTLHACIRVYGGNLTKSILASAYVCGVLQDPLDDTHFSLVVQQHAQYKIYIFVCAFFSLVSTRCLFEMQLSLRLDYTVARH